MDDTTPKSWPVLSSLERRVLGVLVEKAKTTPEAYPLSLKALTTGSNQKTNRDPVMNLSEDQVESAIADLQKKALISRITGGRVERYRHNLYEAWSVGKVELAVLTELLLRGPQTEGELRGRASRMESIESLEELREVLKPMIERGLVFWLGPEGRRGSQIIHGFTTSDERARLAAAAPVEVEEERRREPVESRSPSGPSMSDRMASLEAEVKNLREEIDALKKSLGG